MDLMQELNETRGIKLLEEWMKKRKINKTEFARMMQTSYKMIWNYFQKKYKPSLDFAIRIQDITKGKVPCTSWRSLSKKVSSKNKEKIK
jgi:hypothetical protein